MKVMLLIALISCISCGQHATNSPENKYINPFYHEQEAVNANEKTIPLDENQKFALDTNHVYDAAALTGSWFEYCIWTKNGDRWTGAKSTGLQHCIAFTPANKFIYCEINSTTNTTRFVNGMFGLNKEGNSIEFWLNSRNDTVFITEDFHDTTMKVERRRIFFLNDTVLRMKTGGMYIISGKAYYPIQTQSDKKIMEFRKIASRHGK